MTRDVSSTEPVLTLSSVEPIAVGHLRSVYQHPLHANELIKVMRPDAVEKRWNAPGRWAKRLPRTRHYVQYLRELREFIVARARVSQLVSLDFRIPPCCTTAVHVSGYDLRR